MTYEQVVEGMNAATATSVLQKGIEFGAYEGEIPGDEAALINDAKELLRVAKTAYDSGIRSDAVGGVLGVAGISLDGGAPAQAAAPSAGQKVLVNPQTGETQAFDEAAATALIAAGWTEQGQAQAAPAAGGFDINSVIPGYDDLGAREAVAKIKEITDEATFNAVKNYEAEEGDDRKSIRNLTFQPPAAAAAPAQPPAQPAAAGDQSGYGDRAAMEAAYEGGTVGLETVTANQLPEPGVAELEIPVEIDNVSDVELARLQTRYHNADVRALALLGQQEALRDIANRLGADSYSAAYATFLEEEKSTLGDKMTASGMDGASSRAKHRADSVQSVVAWGNRAARHGAEIRLLKARQMAYEKGVARLSREQSRREKEKELGGTRG